MQQPTAEGEAMQAIVYQNIGFSTEARVWLVDEKSLKVMAEIEDSRVREGEGGAPPSVETRQVSINAVLTDGVPMELTRVQGVTDQSGYLEVRADILK